MKSAIILHGIYGKPDENWFPWLKNELEEHGVPTIVPEFPTYEPLLPEHWDNAFAPYKDQINSETILIGHSLGVAFALKLLEEHSVAAAYFVAPSWGTIHHELDAVIAAVANQDFDWNSITQNCSSFTIYQSDNDPYIQHERADTLAHQLETNVHIIQGAGHFNTASGYTEFKELRDAICSSLE